MYRAALPLSEGGVHYGGAAFHVAPLVVERIDCRIAVYCFATLT